VDHVLSLILFAPIVGAVILIFVSNDRPLLVRGIAVGSSFVSFILSFYLLYSFDYNQGGIPIFREVHMVRSVGYLFLP